MANVETLTDSLNKITVANQQNINDIVSNILVVTQELKRQTPSIAHSLDNVTGNIDDIVGGGKEDISDTIKNLRAVTAKLETTVDNMNDITGQIKKGDGTIGKLVYDNSTVDNINNTLTSLQSSLGKLDKLRVDLSFHGERLFDTNENQGFFRLKLTPNEKRYYLLGLETHPDGRTETTDTHKKRDYTSGGTDFEYYQTEDETKDDLTFTAMYAHRFFDDLYFRIGLEESEFGVGVDYFPFETKNFELNLDVYDFPDKDEDRDAKVKAMAKYKFFENFFITGGVADIANDDTRSVFIGGGVEFNDDDLKYLLGSVPMPK
jgi:phospholipid/cholesterol/gamma-HCH transport system substrate-binding protein